MTNFLKLYELFVKHKNDEDFDKCLEFGCDGIMTDEPLKLKKYLEEKT